MAAPLLKTFEQTVVGKTCVVEKREYDWTFAFGGAQMSGLAVSGGCVVVTETLWRLIDVDRVVLTSEDHGHQFGLPAPLDAQLEIRALLASAVVVTASVDPRTADIALTFDSGSRLEIISTSSGYESWQAYFIDGDQDVALVGAGWGLQVASSPVGSKPTRLVGRPVPES
ncbi:hypothetical protein [Phenylobacterium sp.]|uniref:hypothetical protein n=1 Tax=Phenylobacterium sp. TaxID=1871053 RepID=UPI0030F45F10